VLMIFLYGWFSLVPVGSLLVGKGDAEYGLFVEGLAYNLHTYGQTIGEASRDGDCRQTSDVYG